MKEVGSRVDKSVADLGNVDAAELEAAMAELPEPVKAKAAAVSKPTPVVNARPTSALNVEKRKKLQPKFDKIKEKVEVAKQKAQVEFKKGAYAESTKLYKNAAEILEIAHEDFSVFKKEITQLEAAIFGNIAFCYGKD